MRTLPVRLLALVSSVLALVSVEGMAATGPSTAWNVFTLPNPQVTPNWRSYAPSSCQSDPDACAQDQRFWQLWNFSDFQNAIDITFSAVHSMGKYQGVMLILPLGTRRRIGTTSSVCISRRRGKGSSCKWSCSQNGSTGRNTATCTKAALHPVANSCRALRPRWLIRSF